MRIEDYGIIGDTQTAGLVGRDGSIDWLCLPRFDSGACFAALLGDAGHGRWLIAPAGGVRASRRRYRRDTLVLETEFETEDGMVRLVDCMPPRERDPDVVRVVEGVTGRVSVRIGNAAVTQFQLDVYGEVMDALHQSRRIGIPADAESWSLQRALMEFLESRWAEPDEGIWEVRGPRRHFTHSKVMAWVAADRAVKAVEQFGLDGPVDRWRRLRADIHAEVCERGWNRQRNTFTQYYGSPGVDAALLMIPLVGFLPAGDPRVAGTVTAIEAELCEGGFVHRYRHDEGTIDGLPPGEGAILACTFWLADNYALAGRQAEAVATFERLLGLRNDLGLLAEEWDVPAGRMLGNFPQAFSHVPLVNTARNLCRGGGPGHRRGEEHRSSAGPAEDG